MTVNPYITGGPPRYRHQKVGLRRMIATRGVTALLFDPGMGKTATVIDYAGLLALKHPSGEARVLVVSPLAAVDTWVLQMQQNASPQIQWWAEAIGGTIKQRAEALAARGGRPFTYHLGTRKAIRTPRGQSPRALGWKRAHAWAASDPEVSARQGPEAVGTPRLVLCVLNLDTFSSRAAVGSRTMADVLLEAVKRYQPDLVVVDESHKIKSASGNASRLLGRIGAIVPRRVILTGTVMPHSPLDVFGQWRFLDPMAFSRRAGEAATYGEFRNRYAVLGGWMGKEVTGFQNLDEMQDIMARNAVVARKEQALDLPPTTDVIVTVTLSPREKAAYTQMKNGLAAQLSAGTLTTAGNRLTQMLRLRQITSGLLQADDGTLHVIGSSKIDTIRSLVHDTLIGEKRVVIFVYFVAEARALAQSLAQRDTEVLLVTGDTASEDRARIRKRFGSDDPARLVLIAQIKTMSLAVNELVTASHAIFASLSQQRDDYIQARDRLSRLGQTRPVTFWHVNAPGTVDDVILRSHQDRSSLEDAMLHHIRGEGGEA